MKFRSTALLAQLLPAAPLILALLSPGAQAQPAPAAQAAMAGAEAAATAPAPVIDDTGQAMLLALGHRAGLVRLADQVVDHLVAEGRFDSFFRGAEPAPLKRRLADQFCQVFSASCARDDGHGGGAMPLRGADLPALAGLLQDRMDAQAVPAAAQRALLAGLAPAPRRWVMR